MLARVADDEQYAGRPPRLLYPLTHTRRPSNVVVSLELGTGTDPDALQKALKAWKRKMQMTGTDAASRAYEFYMKPSIKKRLKSLKARRRAAKALRLERRRAAREGS